MQNEPLSWREVARSGLTIPALVFALASASSAQDEYSDPGVDDSALFAEIPSISSASKYEQKITEAPSSVSIITGDEIQKFGYRTLGAALSGQRGVYATNDRNYEYLGVRGFGISGDYNTRILVLVDGHRINDPIYSSAPTGTDFPVNIDLIERIEFVRGANSSVYGSSAFLGVVNIITRRGRDLQGTEINAGAGSQESYLTRITHGQKLDNGFEYLLSGTYQESDGEDRLFFKEFDDPSTNNGIVNDADHDQAYRFFANLAFRNVRVQAGYSSRDKVIPTASFGTEFNTDRTKTTDSYAWADVNYADEFGDGWLVTARTYYDRYYYEGDYLYDYGTVGSPDLVINADEATGERWGGELRVVKRLFERHQVSAGMEFDYNFRQDQSNDDQNPGFNYLSSSQTSVDFGLYLQDEITILDNLHLGLGVRFDRDGEFGGTFNPRASLIYSPLDETTLKFLFGTAYRAPSAYELFYDDNETIVANPDLDPETILTAEIVLEQLLPLNIRLTSSAYYSEIEDLIEQQDIGGDVFQFDNLSEAEAYGLEVLLEKRWKNGLSASIDYAVQRSENKNTGSRLANSPTHLAQARLSIPMIQKILFFSPEARFISERKTASGGGVDDALVLNATLLNRNWIDGLEVQFGVMNLLDAQNEDPASEEFVQEGIEQNGRTFFLKASYKF